MYDLWCENIKTGECFRVTRDESKPVYLREDGSTAFPLEEIMNFKFYPCCPKEAPKMETPETGEQMNIFDFIGGLENGRK